MFRIEYPICITLVLHGISMQCLLPAHSFLPFMRVAGYCPLCLSSTLSFFRALNMQVLGEQFIPEEPTYRANTAGYAEERGDLVTLGANQAPPQRANAAAQAVPGDPCCDSHKGSP